MHVPCARVFQRIGELSWSPRVHFVAASICVQNLRLAELYLFVIESFRLDSK